MGRSTWKRNEKAKQQQQRNSGMYRREDRCGRPKKVSPEEEDRLSPGIHEKSKWKDNLASPKAVDMHMQMEKWPLLAGVRPPLTVT